MQNMKYLYLLIRHIFPRHKWTIIATTKIRSDGEELPVAVILTLQDQFGNIKTKEVSG